MFGGKSNLISPGLIKLWTWNFHFTDRLPNQTTKPQWITNWKVTMWEIIMLLFTLHCHTWQNPWFLLESSYFEPILPLCSWLVMFHVNSPDFIALQIKWKCLSFLWNVCRGTWQANPGKSSSLSRHNTGSYA